MMFIISGTQYHENHSLSAYKACIHVCSRITLFMLLHYPRIHCFPRGVWLCKDHGMMRPTNDRWIPVLLEISNADWCICDAPSWPSRGHQQDSFQYAQFMVTRSLEDCQLNRCFKVLFSRLRRLRLFQLLLGNSFSNFYAVYSFSKHKF